MRFYNYWNNFCVVYDIEFTENITVNSYTIKVQDLFSPYSIEGFSPVAQSDTVLVVCSPVY